MLTPHTFFPVAKPPKRALRSFEVFDLDRLVEILPEDAGLWIVSSKIDGERAQVHVDQGKATVFLDDGSKVDRSRIPEVFDLVEAIPYKQAILDAELVLVDSEGRLGDGTVCEEA